MPINAPSASFPDKNPSAGEGFSGGEEGSAIAVERARNHSFSINTVQNYLGVVSIVFRICFKFKSFSLKNKIMQNFYSIITKKRAQNYKDAKIPKRQKSTFAERVATGCRKAAAKSETGAGHTYILYKNLLMMRQRRRRAEIGTHISGHGKAREQIETRLFRNEQARSRHQDFSVKKDGIPDKEV